MVGTVDTQEFVEGQANYRAQIIRSVTKATVLTIAFAVFFFALYLVSDSGGTPVAVTSLVPSAETSINIFTLLTAASLALQIVLRSPWTQSDLPPGLEFGRREFLTMVAYGLLMASQVWTIVVLARAMSGAPERMLLLHILGVLAWGAFLSVMCADATVVGDKTTRIRVGQALSKERRAAIAARRRRLLRGTRAPSRSTVISECIFLGAVAILPASAGSWILGLGPLGYIVLPMLALVMSGVATVGTHHICTLWETGDRQGSVFAAVILGIYVAAITMGSVAGLAERSGDKGYVQGALVLLVMLTAFVPPPVLLGATRSRRRLLLRRSVVWALSKRLSRFEDWAQEEPRPLNYSAVTAACIGPIFPFGIVFGQIALQELSTPENRERGRGFAIAGIVLSLTSAVLLIALVVIVAMYYFLS